VNAIPRLRPWQGPAVLSYGFRPFFFVGACYAALGIALWLPLFEGEIAVPSEFAPRDWHIHEMLFGYIAAVITGFLLTAIPNWTGRLPLQGLPLLGLLIVWLAGRAVVCWSAYTGWIFAAIIDCAFLVLVVAAAAREIVAPGGTGGICACLCRWAFWRSPTSPFILKHTSMALQCSPRAPALWQSSS